MSIPAAFLGRFIAILALTVVGLSLQQSSSVRALVGDSTGSGVAEQDPVNLGTDGLKQQQQQQRMKRSPSDGSSMSLKEWFTGQPNPSECVMGTVGGVIGGGALTGAFVGAGIGSIFTGPGTVLGALIGGVIGVCGGISIGHRAGEVAC
ncbi:uncharacterized protein LOC129744472 [Uranotaenia lowii]|uniref:uncharacterized protein LOC129744472 n=1 Tax=Uranotaenia lowii TaxID=190385 RepID=UPI002479D9CF|nr:uncharacterized protein LOC129744472 [Uranotaenia lowii]